ncbi:MAG: phosphopentomutase [Lachnospiraceae bacterium]|nr:phosphopentomutase [Lachnospiraceae bacterium]
MSRVIWIVLDSVGMGALPDAADWGDEGADTIGHIFEKRPDLKIPNLKKLGYANIDGIHAGEAVDSPMGAYCRLGEKSLGKDTTIGHWEMIGIYTPSPFPTYPNGFPQDIIDRFIKDTGVPGILCNTTASGTAIINELGDEHRQTKKPIVYTSADSVFQIACDESIYSPAKLYTMCEKARAILVGEHNVARVIARPFVKEGDKYVRTANRRDFSRTPEEPNLLTMIRDAGQSVFGVGKIEDIFAGSGITEAVHTKNNEDGMDQTLKAMESVEKGLIFTNLVEFDSVWGHRRDIDGYAGGLEAFDIRLGELLEKMGDEDTLVICADHGCDPAYKGTDHTREYVPLLLYGNKIRPGVNLGTGSSFADAGETVRELLGIEGSLPIGKSVL